MIVLEWLIGFAVALGLMWCWRFFIVGRRHDDLRVDVHGCECQRGWWRKPQRWRDGVLRSTH